MKNYQLPAHLRKAITEIRRKPYPISDLIPLLPAAADALQARAQVQGEPVGEIKWAANVPNSIREAVFYDLMPLIGTKLYTTPQPAQATQAEVTDERAAFEEWATNEGKWPKAVDRDHNGCYLLLQTSYAWTVWQARAILSLRPDRVPMMEGTARQFVEWMKAQPDDRVPPTIDGALAEFEAHHRFITKADLWCIHIPGTDEVHAAPSKEAAEHMAARHNAAMATYYASGAPNLEFAPSIGNVQAAVVKWPYDKSSHYDELSAFDWAAWGITAQAEKETP